MIASITRAEVRELDRRAIAEFGLPGAVLMENAGRGAAAHLLALGAGGRIVVCCGKGNNGGDGFVLARWLDLAKLSVQILLFAGPDELRGDAKLHYQVAHAAGIPIKVLAARQLAQAEIVEQLHGADWIVDGLLGTGLTGPVQSPLADVIEAINASRAKVLALDLPSGLDCDTGEPLGATVRADHTATFVAWKRGFLAPVTWHWIGQVEVIDIGVPRMLLEQYLPKQSEPAT